MSTIVMVHGAFCGGWAFESFRTSFEAAGWCVIAPDLRGHGEADSTADVIGVSMTDYAADIAKLCDSLPERPVLLGHSMGGLVAQMVARRTKLEALVLLAPSPPWGVVSGGLEEAMTALGVHMLGPFSSGAVDGDRTLMRQFTVDRLSGEDAAPILDRLRPESSVATRQALNWWLDPFMTTSVGPGPLGLPAIALAGQYDLVHQPATVRRVAARIGAGFEMVPGMSHWLMDGPGSEGVARTVLDWLSAEIRAAA